MAERDFDVVVFGATSVTGRRVAAYLQGRAPETDCTWAAAGRDEERVRQVLAGEGVGAPAVIAADVDNPASLLEMASRAGVVLNLVGPYTRHGRPVIEACVAGGAHYVDLTGEIPFARRITREFDGPAKDAGVKIVQVCGFEALPPDLGVLLAAETADDRWGADLTEVDVTVAVLGLPPGVPRPSDMLSGGTMQSLAEAVGDEDAAAIRDPACLIDDPARAQQVRSLSPIAVRARRGADHAAIAPMAPAAFINPAVIHRSAALADPAAARLPLPRGRCDPGRAGQPAAAHGGGGSAVRRPARRRGRRGRPPARPTVRVRLPSPRAPLVWLRSARGPPRAVALADDHRGHHERREPGRGGGRRGRAPRLPHHRPPARRGGTAAGNAGRLPDRAGCLTPALAIGTQEIMRFDAAGLRFAVTPAG